ncbi:MAG: YggS family pyridoxal phosphate-dependent enzyme [Flavobacteriia bacterium]|jgi:pyridoxal phosphate enzyme (YggS family)
MISRRLQEIIDAIPDHVTLVAVSKTKPTSAIQEAYNAGQRHFGENKVQEMTDKSARLPKDIHWHLIGHLQTNKVKYIASFVSLIHSIDSLKLLQEINKHAIKHNRVIDCLLQFHIAKEETKFGLDLAEANVLLGSEQFSALKNIRIVGVMGMASFTPNEKEVRKEFSELRGIFTSIKNKWFADENSFKIISMGMSGDYGIAIEEGSTMVRVGSSIFGSR